MKKHLSIKEINDILVNETGAKINYTICYPQIYIDKINDKKVTEIMNSDHGACIAIDDIHFWDDKNREDYGKEFGWGLYIREDNFFKQDALNLIEKYLSY